MSLTDTRSAIRHDDREPISFDFARLRHCSVAAMLVRFAFGFGVSVLVGVVTVVFGDRVGGLFLAFPAILPASLTLIADEDGKRKASVDAAGAIVGGIALVAFGAVSWFLLPRIPPVWAELIAFVAWCTLAVGLYLVVRRRVRSS
jgi:uncharacterized protein DUF3147